MRLTNKNNIANDPSVTNCAREIEEITQHLLTPIENNIKRELSQIFKDSENPEIPYFQVVMDIMQFMNDFVGDPHTVELIFSRINDEVARKKLEQDDKISYSDKEWNQQVAESAIQKLRDSGTERDYQFMTEKLLETLVHSTDEKGLKIASMRLNNIIKKHSIHELDQLDAELMKQMP